MAARERMEHKSGKVSLRSLRSFAAIVVSFLFAGTVAHAQVNSGSNGSDGAFNPTTNTVINMADHPNGIYQYTSVNISNGVTVRFIPKANNTPVVWLVQSNVVINGTVNVSGQYENGGTGGTGGAGGYRGGNGGTLAGPGQGPGGGAAGGNFAGSGSYGTLGQQYSDGTNGAGAVYGNIFVVPLVGGSGGGGARTTSAPNVHYNFGGGGGGGALLIAASQEIQLNGQIYAQGGQTTASVDSERPGSGGGGSGGAVRLIASRITGIGTIDAGPSPLLGSGSPTTQYSGGGMGRVRLDSPDLNFGGTIIGVSSQGYQPIILQTNGQGAQLVITSVGGVPVSVSPTGQLSTPDAVLSGQQNNPIPIVVHCSNIPLNTQITVSVKPANGTAVSATGFNNTGTLASSTATVSINMPRGGGIIYATAATNY